MKKLDYKKCCASVDRSIRQVAEIIDRLTLKTVYITSSKNKLLGSVTDGDLRRAIINGISLDQNISRIMNPNPKFILRGQGDDVAAWDLMKRLNLKTVPIVDEQMSIVNILPIKQAQSTSALNNPVIIMAGGFGSRLMPLTKDTPKPMLKIAGKPILERVIDNFISQGFSEFYISVYYLSNQIKDYFGDGHSKGVQIHYLEEDQPMGTGGCLSLLPKPLSTSPHIIANGDILSTIDYRALIQFHKSNGAIATMATRNYEIKVPFGVIESDGTQLLGIKEKPTFDVMINAGIYLLDPEIISTLDNREIQITNIFSSLLAQNKSVHCFPLVESWADVGHHDDFQNAQLRF